MILIQFGLPFIQSWMYIGTCEHVQGTHMENIYKIYITLFSQFCICGKMFC